MAFQPTMAFHQDNDILQIADKLKQYNVSHEHIQLLMAYLKDNGMSYDEIMKDVANASKSSLYQFFSNQLKNESLFHILVQILKPHKKKPKSSTMNTYSGLSILDEAGAKHVRRSCAKKGRRKSPLVFSPLVFKCAHSVMRCSALSIKEYDTIGLSIGGAKDINHFRNCIENNQMPSIDSITYNGLLNEYYFDTQTRKHVEQKIDLDDASMLFYPTYCCAKVQKEDDGKERDYYMSVGLNSNIKQNEFKRKHLNLIILWDKSGSMQSTFNDDESADYSDVDINAKWRETLAVNDKIIVKDRSKWYEAQVITKWYVNKDKNKVQIHYVGWDKKYDEWIEINSDRLAPFRKINNKMRCSKSAIKSILQQLTPKDRLGIITFNGEADIVQKLQFINDIHKNELQQKINDVEAGGSTDFEKGYQTTVQMYLKLFADNEYILNSSHDDYDNRVIVLTDAQPNTGSLDSNSLLKMIESYAENDNEIMDEFERNRIYTTFIGIGLDFNTSLIERISNTRGCNYYSVKSTKEFDDKMKEEFDHMVTPLVFNVCLKLKSEGNSCTIDVVYGSDDNKAADIIANGEISRIHTLFPSKKRTKEEGGATKGGIQLIKLKKHNDVLSDDIDVRIEVTFEDRNGKKYENIQNVLFNPPKESLNIDNDMIEMDDNECEQMNVNFYDNIGIRKAILLCNYVEIMRKWIESDGDRSSYASELQISAECKPKFQQFKTHFENEMKLCKDDELQKELEILNKLLNLEN